MRAAVVIEGVETHTRTGFVEVDLSSVPGLPGIAAHSGSALVQVPVTHAKVFGWYETSTGATRTCLATSPCVANSLD